MKFQCDKCGGKLTVPDTKAGERATCPICKEAVTIPASAVQEAADTADPPVGSSKESPLQNSLLLDVAPADVAGGGPAAGADATEAAYEKLRMLQVGYRLKEDEEAPQRKLPWMVDILLYPLNKPGLTILMISVGIPFVLRATLKFMQIFCIVFPPALVFWVLLIILHWLALLLLVLYMNWYLCQCIRDSASGGIRAADTTAETPGLGELFGQSLTVLATLGACMAPALAYLLLTHAADGSFQVLYGVGGFLFPMALLAVVMFESLWALNPVLLLGSIGRTFLRYSVLVAACYASCLLIPAAGYFLFRFWILGYLLLFLAWYELLILAHLLGRLYWNSQERLNWDT